MDEQTRARLRALSEKAEPHTAVTVRYSKSIDQEIKTFCGQNPGIKKSVVLRECIERGWQAVNQQRTEEP